MKLLFPDPISFYTLLLCIVGAVQAGLFVWQLRLIRKSLADSKSASQATKQLAEIAERQARAALAAELPNIVVTVRNARGAVPVSTVDGPPDLLALEVVFVNHGRTPAKVLRWGATCRITDKLPAEVDPIATTYAAPGYLLRPGVEDVYPITASLPKGRSRTDFVSGKAALYVYGTIETIDFLGERSIRLFCRKGLFHAGSVENPIMFVFDDSIKRAYDSDADN